MGDLVGDVDGCDVIIVDDMIDTAGTLCKAGKELKRRGAKRIYAFATHGLFSGPAIQRIEDSCFEKEVVCNTIPMDDGQKSTKILQLSWHNCWQKRLKVYIFEQVFRGCLM